MIWIAPEVARMVGHPLVAEKNHDALSMRSNQHHPAGGSCINAVAIMVGHDQARGGSPTAFDKTIEWSA